MIATKYLGRYNVFIKKGHLDEDDRTNYILQIERNDDDGHVEETKTYYIIGYKNETTQMYVTYTTLMELWLAKLRFMEIERIFFMFPEGYKFKMAEPSLVSA